MPFSFNIFLTNDSETSKSYDTSDSVMSELEDTEEDTHQQFYLGLHLELLMGDLFEH